MLSTVIVDYRVGNIFSMKQALEKVGFSTTVTANTAIIKKSDSIILPGVGNFGVASKNLQKFAETLKTVIENGVPLLGSCLGMQLLFEDSEEATGEGLKLIKGNVVRFQSNIKVPHMGWNTVRRMNDSELLEGLDNEYFYFVHSYYPIPNNSQEIAGITEYGSIFTSVVSKGNVHGTQFHPEKSGEAGLQLLRNFASITRR